LSDKDALAPEAATRLRRSETPYAMPEIQTIRRAHKARSQGKAPSTQAGEFVREEIEHVREGKHGGRSVKQAIAIGLSKARRAGIDLPPPKEGSTSDAARRKAERDTHRARSGAAKKPSPAVKRALRREGHSAASKRALSRQARSAAHQKSASTRSAGGRKAAQTRG